MKPPNHEHDEIEIDKDFLIFNGVTGKNKTSTSTGIELITITPTHTSYTSLRDVIGGASSPSAPASPSWKSCREDVPIRNPLVKQAALSYLQPLSSPPGIDDRSWAEKLTANLNRCFAGEVDGEGVELGCMSPLDGVVLAPIKEALGRIFRAFSMTEDHQD